MAAQADNSAQEKVTISVYAVWDYEVPKPSPIEVEDYPLVTGGSL